MKRDDILWKAALEDMFDDFLRFFFPNADEIFDFNKKFHTWIRNWISYFLLKMTPTPRVM
jgi:hypothetical protein